MDNRRNGAFPFPIVPYAGLMKKVKLSLQASESVVVEAAARIYAGYLASGRITDGEEKQWMQRSISEAIELAQLVDAYVQSDNEMN